MFLDLQDNLVEITEEDSKWIEEMKRKHQIYQTCGREYYHLDADA